MLKKLTIGQRLAVGYAIKFMIFLAVFLYAMSTIKYVSNQTKMFYDHPFIVSNALLRIDGYTDKIRLAVRRAAFSANKDEVLAFKSLVSTYEVQIDKDINIAEERFLGDKKSIENIRINYNRWKTLREHFFLLLMEGKKDEAQVFLDSTLLTNRHEIDNLLKETIGFAQNKALTFYTNVENSNVKAIYSMYFTVIVAFLITCILGFVFTRSITGPLVKLIGITREISSGKLDVPVDIYSKDEIGKLAESFRNMTEKLRSIFFEKDLEDWKKTGQSGLNDRMRGEQDMAGLAQNIINFLAEYSKAHIGAIYLVSDKKLLKMAGSYAYNKRKNLSNEFSFGSGLVGQAALEKQSILLTNVPPDYIKISSGLGELEPCNILVVPLLHESEVKGIVELGSFNKFTDAQIEFMQTVSESIAIAFSVTQARENTKELLRITQNQAEELQVQQEELQASNEELSNQSKILKESEAELQTQQEELRQANEELEERSNLMEKQRDEIKKKNVELEKSQQINIQRARDLEITSRYKSEFLANMSHELRTPLNSILLLSKYLFDNKEGNLSEKQLESVRTVYSSGKDLLNLINDILDLSKVESGKIELNIDAINISEIKSFIESNFMPLVQDKGLSLNIVIAKDVPDSIRTDVQKVYQILRNLISNAIKFTEKGNVTIGIAGPKTKHLPSGTAMPGNAIVISVSDTGIGIPKDKQDVIFEAFKQADGTTSRKYGGTGLGLTISRELAKFIGGEISVKSETGVGSTFTLYLSELQNGKIKEIEENFPNREADKPQYGATLSAQTQMRSHSNVIIDDRNNLPSGEKSILIIEDDDVFSKMLLDIGHEKGFKCIIAGDGQMGIEYANTYKPDAIILDIGLPVMGGWSVMEKLKDSSATRNIPVHVISASEKNIDVMKTGVIGYITKPVSMEKIDGVFKKIEEVFSENHRRLLAVNVDKDQKSILMELIINTTVEPVFASSEEASIIVESSDYDCIVLNLSGKVRAGFDLLDKLKSSDHLIGTPVIIYNSASLTKEDEIKLSMYSQKIILKKVKSTERLLDEIVLFLHLIESRLPEEKQKLLGKVHDKESIFKDKKILLVDDDARNVFALTSVLEERGLNVLIGRNGKEGIECLKNIPGISLILMDIMMPEMDGYEAIREIRKMYDYKNIPIIALTAKAMKDDKLKCIEAGANDYLSKPIEAERLLSLLRVWLYQ
ncbi:MAG: response regulator [Nitrospirae bacterium]|nr:response regulator [Nitrospirota bacterium]